MITSCYLVDLVSGQDPKLEFIWEIWVIFRKFWIFLKFSWNFWVFFLSKLKINIWFKPLLSVTSQCEWMDSGFVQDTLKLTQNHWKTQTWTQIPIPVQSTDLQFKKLLFENFLRCYWPAIEYTHFQRICLKINDCSTKTNLNFLFFSLIFLNSSHMAIRCRIIAVVQQRDKFYQLRII